MKETVNEDTYQTLKEVKVTPYEKALSYVETGHRTKRNKESN